MGSLIGLTTALLSSLPHWLHPPLMRWRVVLLFLLCVRKYILSNTPVILLSKIKHSSPWSIGTSRCWKPWPASGPTGCLWKWRPSRRRKWHGRTTVTFQSAYVYSELCEWEDSGALWLEFLKNIHLCSPGGGGELRVGERGLGVAEAGRAGGKGRNAPGLCTDQGFLSTHGSSVTHSLWPHFCVSKPSCDVNSLEWHMLGND